MSVCGFGYVVAVQVEAEESHIFCGGELCAFCADCCASAPAAPSCRTDNLPDMPLGAWFHAAH